LFIPLAKKGVGKTGDDLQPSEQSNQDFDASAENKKKGTTFYTGKKGEGRKTSKGKGSPLTEEERGKESLRIFFIRKGRRSPLILCEEKKGVLSGGRKRPDGNYSAWHAERNASLTVREGGEHHIREKKRRDRRGWWEREESGLERDRREEGRVPSYLASKGKEHYIVSLDRSEGRVQHYKAEKNLL